MQTLKDFGVTLPKGTRMKSARKPPPVPSNDSAYPFPHLSHKTHYFCSKCYETFLSFSDLKAHDASCLKPKELFICKYCDKSYANLQSLEDHLHRHESRPKWSCDKCGKTFLTQELRDVHLKVLHTEYYDACGDGVQCKICDIKMKTKSRIVAHINSKHFLVTPNLCDLCGKCFTTPRVLRIHKTSHESGKNWLCKECPKIFNSEYRLTAHERTHEGRSYMCTECGRTFKTKFNFDCHMRQHREEYRFQCTVCNKKFVAKYPADCHLKKHYSNHS